MGTWEDWFANVTADPYRPGKKKKKPFVGPTRAAAKTGQLATAQSGRQNVVDSPRPAVGRVTPTVDEQPKPPKIPQQLLGQMTTSAGGIIAGTLIANTSPPSLTPEEDTTRNISIAYFQHKGKLPSPGDVFALLSNPATSNLSVEEYKRLFKDVDKLPAAPDRNGTDINAFQTGEVPLESQIGGQRGPQMPDYIEATRDVYRPNVNVTAAQVQKDMQAIVKSVPSKQPKTIFEVADPDSEVLALSELLAERLRNRKAPVEWDVENPYKDPDFLRNAAVYAMGRQFAFSAFGRGKDQSEANKTIEYLRTLPFTDNSWQTLGKKLGVSVADWSNQQTFAMTLDAIRSTDNDVARQAVYDAWMFGRPKGDSASQARYEFAEKFGSERLPAKVRAEYEQSTDTLQGKITAVMGIPGEAWQRVVDVPVIGAMLAPVGYVASEGGKLLMRPIEEALRGVVTAYDVGTMADASRKGYTLNEYQAAMGRGEEFDNAESWRLDRWNWHAFTDLSNWSRAYEEAAGRTPVSVLAQNISLDQVGYVAPWAKDVGDLADFSVMMYLGAKTGDPIVRGGVKMAAKGGYVAGRSVEAYVGNARRRYGAEGARGEWILKVGKNDLDAITPEARTRVEELQREYEGHHNTLSSDMDAAAARKDLNAPADLTKGQSRKDIVSWIKSRGGIDADSVADHVGGGATRGDAQSAFGGTLKKRRTQNISKKELEGSPQPVALDVIVDELNGEFPGLDLTTNSLAEMLGQRTTRPAGGLPAAEVKSTMDRMDAIEGEMATLLAKRDASPMDAPAQVRDNNEFIDSFNKEHGVRTLKSGAVENINDVRFYLTDAGDAVNLDTIKAFKTKTGVGTKLMEALVKKADDAGVTIRLTAQPLGKFGEKMSKENLKRYYEKLGFKEVDPETTSPALMDVMERTPESKAPVTTNDAGVKVSEVTTATEDVPLTSSSPHKTEKGVEVTESQKSSAAKADGLPDIGEKLIMERDKRGGGRETVEVEIVGYNAQLNPQGTGFSISAIIKAPDVRTGEFVESGFIGGGVSARRVRTVPVDASIAPQIQRLNDGGYKTRQSHGLESDHPKGHPEAEPYVEFSYSDLKVDGSVKTKAGLIRAAAERAGATVERRTKPSTIVVKGDIAKFTDELMGRPSMGEPPVPPVRAIGADTGAPGPAPVDAIDNAIFRSQAEVATVIDDPAELARIFRIEETDDAAHALVLKAAASGNLEEVTSIMENLRENHGVEFDGGAGATMMNARHAAYRKSFGYRSPIRLFITPTTYERMQSIEGSTENLYDVMMATKFGMKTLTKEGAQRIREIRREMFTERSALKKRNIVKKAWLEIEANIIAEEGSLDGLLKYEARWYKAQGRSIVSGSRKAYHANREGKEASRVATPGKARAHAQSRIDEAVAKFDKLTEGTSPAFKAKAQKAIDEATAEMMKVDEAAQYVVDNIDRTDLTALEKGKLQRMKNRIDSYGSDVPMKMGQAAKHIVHSHNPRIASWYMSGKTGRTWGLVDQAVAEPFMRSFKETVMASLGFPMRVNIGDEYVRLIPEGTVSRWREGRQTKAELKKQGVFEEISTETQDQLAYDWAFQDSGEMEYITQAMHPRYYEYLEQDLRSWAAEPIVQRLLEKHGGEFPEDVGDLHTFIRGILDEDTDLGKQMRNFLDDTYHYENGTLNETAFREWTDLWQDRLEVISADKTLRQSMVSRVTPKDLERVNKDLLWPVNAPSELISGGSKNPLYAIQYANPFHYVYRGVPIGAGRKVGTVNLLGSMSKWLKETVFSDQYYLQKKDLLARSPHLGETPEGLTELHNLAVKNAGRYMEKVTYSRSTTLAEDMARNLIPFVSAYRQFYQYWLGAFLKHPVSMSTAIQKLPAAQQSALDLAGQGLEGATGADVTVDGQFAGVGDYAAFIPSVPFWAVKDEGAAEGLMGTMTSNLPQASFLVTGPARTLASAVGADPDSLSKLPMLAGMSTSMAPFSRQARLWYGVTGDTWFGDTNATLFGDPAKLEKAHANAILAQMAYDDNGTGPDVKRNTPFWWKPFETVGNMVGFAVPGTAKPEALFAEIMKSFAPSPASITYSPKVTRDKNQWLFDYYDKQRKGDTEGAAQERVSHQWLDRYLNYYDATYAEQVEMKRDPANADILKFWVSPYNYDKSAAPLDGRDWQDQFVDGRVSYKEEDQYAAAIHNLYTDIHGGTYVQSDLRTGGTQYEGDSPRATAEKRTKAKITAALTWAKKTAKVYAKRNGWSEDTLVYQFQNPDKNFGIWPDIIKAAGKDEADFNVKLIAEVFADKYGADYKLKPQYLSSTDALRALDMTKWLPNPDVAKRLETETPFSSDITEAKNTQRNDVIKAVVQSAADENWYWIGSQQLSVVGIKASPKIDTIQLDLNKEYLAMKKFTVGSKEYKAARNAFYAHRDKALGGVKGGALISGGVADRLAALPFVLTPNVTTMGTGKGAVNKQRGYNNFALAVKNELKKSVPNSDHIGKAWAALVGWREYAPKQQSELARVAAWSFLLAESKNLRHELRTHYSDYYDAPGESSASKYGAARVDKLNKLTKQLRVFSPDFGMQIDTWFGKDSNIGTRMLDWYSY